MRSSIFILAICCLLVGCAKHEYAIKEPPDLSRHIGQSDQIVARDGIEYRLRTVDSRLVIQIYNNNDDAIRLDGGGSFVVDPKGQSHPLRSQSIAPRSFAKLIFPPIRPRIEPSGPTFGIGIGMQAHRDRRNYDPVKEQLRAPEPKYFVIYDENDAEYWDWGGETDVRVKFVYHQKDKTIEHEFTFHRIKM